MSKINVEKGLKTIFIVHLDLEFSKCKISIFPLNKQNESYLSFLKIPTLFGLWMETYLSNAWCACNGYCLYFTTAAISLRQCLFWAVFNITPIKEEVSKWYSQPTCPHPHIPHKKHKLMHASKLVKVMNVCIMTRSSNHEIRANENFPLGEVLFSNPNSM